MTNILSSPPDVSIVMAVYNGERYLRECIESILKQTYKDFEFVIVNDASTDKTVDIITSYNDPRIRLINNRTNLGQTKSLNIGIGEARGEYIARIDADDYAYRSRLERQIRYAKKHPEYAAVGTSAIREYLPSGIKRIYRGASDFSEVIIRLFYTTPLLHVSVLMRKDVFLRVGCYNEKFLVCSDHALWSNFIKCGYKIISLPEILVKFRVNNQSYSAINQKRLVFEYTEIFLGNINNLTNLKISYMEAEKFCRAFKLRTYGLIEEDYERVEYLFKEIFNHLKSPLNKTKIHRRKIILPILEIYRKRGVSSIKSSDFFQARKILYKSMKRYGFQLPIFLIFISTFLGKNIINKLIKYRLKIVR